jgi:Flp pilus assembly protein TadD
MDEESDDVELRAPGIVFPGMAAHEHAYRTAYDLLARRFPKEALDVLEPALAEDPGNAGLRTLRAWAYLMRAQLARAEAELRTLVEEYPADVWARHALGRALERQSRYEEALPHLRLAAAMSDDYDHQAAVIRVRNLIAREQ